jgi:hypothetical protein
MACAQTAPRVIGRLLTTFSITYKKTIHADRILPTLSLIPNTCSGSTLFQCGKHHFSNNKYLKRIKKPIPKRLLIPILVAHAGAVTNHF